MRGMIHEVMAGNCMYEYAKKAFLIAKYPIHQVHFDGVLGMAMLGFPVKYTGLYLSAQGVHLCLIYRVCLHAQPQYCQHKFH